MYFLRLTCPATEVENVSGELWDAGTAGIQEIDYDHETLLLAGFETNDDRVGLLERFVLYAPEWEHDDTTDWIACTKEAWPPRCVGQQLYLAPPWSEVLTPAGRHRVIHNPGLACGTGEHPCTQLALEALERCIAPGDGVVDVGTGSGILTIAALRLDAAFAMGIDTDQEAVFGAAVENFTLNGFAPMLAVGSADVVKDAVADVTVANISGTVLVYIADDLLRITKPKGKLILTGFSEWELPAFFELFPSAEVSAMNEWRCLQVSL
jgi:ribosomal protein L11 methyltransferase